MRGQQNDKIENGYICSCPCFSQVWQAKQTWFQGENNNNKSDKAEKTQTPTVTIVEAQTESQTGQDPGIWKHKRPRNVSSKRTTREQIRSSPSCHIIVTKAQTGRDLWHLEERKSKYAKP